MQKFEIFRTGLLKFLEAGYLYIGMDHFAKPGDELALSQQNRTLHRNFQGYTTKAGADLYGMGVTAISGIQNAYAQNHRDLAAWEKAVGERGVATMRGYRLSEEDRLRRAVISRLLCHTVVVKDGGACSSGSPERRRIGFAGSGGDSHDMARTNFYSQPGDGV
jgi:oxygen-independent coproporphyrinogen-3 oxidase